MTNQTRSTGYIKSLGSDLPSSIVVFLVALPLCLGVALASNAPLFSGIIAGVCGGIVVGLVSRSHLSVSGPAAGLTAIVAAAITSWLPLRLFSGCCIGRRHTIGFRVLQGRNHRRLCA